eukprot:897746-Rhodomonas_salina.2
MRDSVRETSRSYARKHTLRPPQTSSLAHSPPLKFCAKVPTAIGTGSLHSHVIDRPTHSTSSSQTKTRAPSSSLLAATV